MEVTRKTLTLSADLHLSYLTWGAGDPVMLLHGLADHGLVWQSLAESLGDRYLCITPDLRGHGESSKPPETDYDSRMLAADLETLAQHLSLDSVHVAAHSWAAKVALVWARQQPQRIRSLILVDPFFVNRLPGFLRPTFPILYRILPFLKVMGPFPTYEAAAAIARRLKQYRGWSPLQESVFQAGMEQKPEGCWGSKFAIAARNGVFQDTLQLAGLTEAITTPTNLMLPKQGLNRTAFQLKPYKQHLIDLTITPIPGNHWPHLVEPQAFNQAVADFLDLDRG
ncbi:MAG: alpha/beta hydrolase [Pseudanabaenales cyanobacterium]|nr:alpha/beta hydrolase [Pseudanabaenales cyanobacterium]